MSDELNKKIQGLIHEINKKPQTYQSIASDYHIRIDSLKHMLDAIETPLDMLNKKRYNDVSSMLYAATRQALNYGTDTVRRSLPVMRLDVSKLTSLLELLSKMGLLQKALLSDSLIINNKERKDTLISLLNVDIIPVNYLDSVMNISRKVSHDDIQAIAGLMQQWTEESIMDLRLSMPKTLLNTLRLTSDHDIGLAISKEIDTAWTNSAMTPVYNSLASALFTWSRDPKERSASQKGKGIQLLSEVSSSKTFHTGASVFLTLDSAKTASTAELLGTLDIMDCHMVLGIPSSLGDILRSQTGSLYIRTCPASPRPGVLPNIKADNIGAFVEGVRFLAEAMSDPNHPDYDPEGELCVMKYMDSDVSGVLVKGHNSMVVGLGTSGVTAGEGSTIIIPLSDSLAIDLRNKVNAVMSQAPDGYDNHELELVWPKEDPAGNYSHLGVNLVNCITKPGFMESGRLPVMTQIRGLGRPKPQLKAPSTYIDQETGETVTMTIRGNVPSGVVAQAHYEDVGKGDLSDCAKLEADLKAGVITDGQTDFVIYCPSGSTNCHAAGVANDFNLAIVYSPAQEDITWTEVDGWVTDAIGVEPSPYDPTPFTSYFFDGCRDGDRYWDYGYHPLSQFFHSFISSPYNDPRFEAYLAGFYSTWLVKATLAVALGESRHGYASQAQFTVKAGLLPSLILYSSVGSNGLHRLFHKGPVGPRTTFYKALRHVECGLEGMEICLKALRECYTSAVSWSTSYGGKKYRQSIDKALDAVKDLIDLQSGGSVKKVLGSINILENAVHNCSYFFDKFVGSKTYFDIGTSNHQTLGGIPQQYLTVVALHTHFYNNVLTTPEPHRVADEANAPSYDSSLGKMKEYNEVFDILTHPSHTNHLNKHVLQTISKITKQPHSMSGVSINDNSLGLRAFQHVNAVMDWVGDWSAGDEGRHLHKVGTCVFSQCTKQDCMKQIEEIKHGLNPLTVKSVQEVLGNPSIALNNLYKNIPAFWKDVLSASNDVDIDNNVFTQPIQMKTNTGPFYEEDKLEFSSGDEGRHLHSINECALIGILRMIEDYPFVHPTLGTFLLKKGQIIISPHDIISYILSRMTIILYRIGDEHGFEGNTYPSIFHAIMAQECVAFLSKYCTADELREIQSLWEWYSIMKDQKRYRWDVVADYMHPINGSEGVCGYTAGRTSMSYGNSEDLLCHIFTLWLSDEVIINDGWGVYNFEEVGFEKQHTSYQIGSNSVMSQYHAAPKPHPNMLNASNTVFTGHSPNELIHVLTSIIDIDVLKQILEEQI
tara:strand:- start:36387 stop:40208 length:3822 start_codon:yes stop_codon:yes gene_type:complete